MAKTKTNIPHTGAPMRASYLYSKVTLTLVRLSRKTNEPPKINE
jgi:hypothetical protein